MAKLQLEVFNYTKYEDATCSKCGKALRHCFVVASVDDEDGYEWRMFDEQCWNEIKHLSPEEIYQTYEPAGYM
jgi:hypothetical protein